MTSADQPPNPYSREEPSQEESRGEHHASEGGDQPVAPSNDAPDPGFDQPPGSPYGLRQPDSPNESGQYSSPYDPGQYNSPYDSGQYNSPYDSGQYNSPYGPRQPDSPYDSGQYNSPYGARQPDSPYSAAPYPGMPPNGEDQPYAGGPVYGESPYEGSPYQANFGGSTPYGMASYSAPPVQHPQATLALILGILGLAVCPFVGIAALLIGNKARKQIDAAPGQFAGRGMATAGFVMGIVSVALIVLMVLIVILGIAGALGS